MAFQKHQKNKSNNYNKMNQIEEIVISFQKNSDGEHETTYREVDDLKYQLTNKVDQSPKNPE